MYINLYTARQIERMKESMLWLGLFMLSGGMAALLHDVVMQEQPRIEWAMAAFLVSLIGVLLVAVSTDKIELKTAYFSVTPVRISYRLNLYGRECMIYWQHVASVQLSERYILFDLNSGRQVLLKLTALHSPSAASNIAVSVHKTALENHVTVNGVRFSMQ